jgi:KTSC domain
MERSLLASSSVASAGHDEVTLVLEIEFTSGRIYQFEEVPRGVYEWLVRTPNKGAYVARMINNVYRYKDVTPRTQTEQLADDNLIERLRDSVRWLEDKKPR